MRNTYNHTGTHDTSEIYDYERFHHFSCVFCVCGSGVLDVVADEIVGVFEMGALHFFQAFLLREDLVSA